MPAFHKLFGPLKNAAAQLESKATTTKLPSAEIFLNMVRNMEGRTNEVRSNALDTRANSFFNSGLQQSHAIPGGGGFKQSSAGISTLAAAAAVGATAFGAHQYSEFQKASGFLQGADTSPLTKEDNEAVTLINQTVVGKINFGEARNIAEYPYGQNTALPDGIEINNTDSFKTIANAMKDKYSTNEDFRKALYGDAAPSNPDDCLRLDPKTGYIGFVDTGVHCHVMEKTEADNSKHCILAFGGTNSTRPTIEDGGQAVAETTAQWIDNAHGFGYAYGILGSEPRNQMLAKEIAKAARDKFPEAHITAVGHSKGAGEALAAGGEGLNAVVAISPPKVHQDVEKKCPDNTLSVYDTRDWVPSRHDDQKQNGVVVRLVPEVPEETRSIAQLAAEALDSHRIAPMGRGLNKIEVRPASTFNANLLEQCAHASNQIVRSISTTNSGQANGQKVKSPGIR
jgi:hypothetical protein